MIVKLVKPSSVSALPNIICLCLKVLLLLKYIKVNVHMLQCEFNLLSIGCMHGHIQDHIHDLNLADLKGGFSVSGLYGASECTCAFFLFKNISNN